MNDIKNTKKLVEEVSEAELEKEFENEKKLKEKLEDLEIEEFEKKRIIDEILMDDSIEAALDNDKAFDDTES